MKQKYVEINLRDNSLQATSERWLEVERFLTSDEEE